MEIDRDYALFEEWNHAAEAELGVRIRGPLLSAPTPPTSLGTAGRSSPTSPVPYPIDGIWPYPCLVFCWDGRALTGGWTL
jgi:hypothetical protein